MGRAETALQDFAYQCNHCIAANRLIAVKGDNDRDRQQTQARGNNPFQLKERKMQSDPSWLG